MVAGEQSLPLCEEIFLVDQVEEFGGLVGRFCRKPLCSAKFFASLQIHANQSGF